MTPLMVAGIVPGVDKAEDVGLPWWSSDLRLHAPNEGGLGSILVRERDPTCHN